jgi:trk system potassium uptake protein TrkA
MYVIVVGAGEIGLPLTDLAVRAGHEVVVVERDAERADAAAKNHDCLVIHGDATENGTLVDAGVEKADAVVSTTDEDAVNVMVMLLAQGFDVPSLVSVVRDAEHMDLFRQFGVNTIENPQQVIAQYLLRAVQRPSVEDFMQLADGAEVFEITVVEDAPIAGVTLKEADESGLLGDGVRVVAIERDGTTQLPTGDTVVQPGDQLSVLSLAGATPDVAWTFTGDNRITQV